MNPFQHHALTHALAYASDATGKHQGRLGRDQMIARPGGWFVGLSVNK